jgi:hypothetical protein
MSGFRKVGPCLYRYRNGNYYARFKSGGKEIRCSLETTDRKLAERNLAKKKDDQSQIDRSQGKLTIAELRDRYLKTVQHQKAKTNGIGFLNRFLVQRHATITWPKFLRGLARFE